MKVHASPSKGKVCVSPPAPCKGGCEHSDGEHRAFNSGVRDGRAGAPCSANPFKLRALRHAWFTGRTVGALDLKAGASTIAKATACEVMIARAAALPAVKP